MSVQTEFCAICANCDELIVYSSHHACWYHHGTGVIYCGQPNEKWGPDRIAELKVPTGMSHRHTAACYVNKALGTYIGTQRYKGSLMCGKLEGEPS